MISDHATKKMGNEMNRQFSDVFNTAINHLLDISNDDLPAMPEKHYTAQEMSLIAEHWTNVYEQDRVATKADPFQAGMLVFVQSRKGPYYAKIVKRLGWSDYWAQNKYDVKDVFGNERLGVFEQDVERVTLGGDDLFRALSAGVIDGGRA